MKAMVIAVMLLFVGVAPRSLYAQETALQKAHDYCQQPDIKISACDQVEKKWAALRPHAVEERGNPAAPAIDPRLAQRLVSMTKAAHEQAVGHARSIIESAASAK